MKSTTVKQTMPIRLSHDALREFLPSYATEEVCGNDPQAAYPQVAAHLLSCVACDEELEELLELMVPAYLGHIPAAPSYAQADLSFLKPQQRLATTASKPGIIEEVQRLLIIFSDSLLDMLKQPSLAGAMRGQLLYSYAVESEQRPQMNCQIDIFTEDAAGKQAKVEVMVEVPTRDPFEQAGCQVMMYTNDRRWQAETDEAGTVEFDDVPLALLPHLRIEVTPSG